MVETKNYQTPLEINGIAQRDALKSFCYYKKNYPYANYSDSSYLRTSNTYISSTYWRPTTNDLEFNPMSQSILRVSRYFNIQQGNTVKKSSSLSNGTSPISESDKANYNI